jgi:hypothetical protein
VDDFLKWNEAIKDYDEFYFAMLRSSRNEMDQWMRTINAQFLSQVAVTVDRFHSINVSTTTECFQNVQNMKGTEIQTIIQQVQADFDYYQRDYVWLLLDVTDQYVSFNQKWAKSVWSEFNMVMRMDIITNWMERYIYMFYKSLFEAQVEEVLIQMHYFNDLMNETRRRAFFDLDAVGSSMERELLLCN